MWERLPAGFSAERSVSDNIIIVKCQTVLYSCQFALHIARYNTSTYYFNFLFAPQTYNSVPVTILWLKVVFTVQQKNLTLFNSVHVGTTFPKCYMQQ